MKPFVSPPVLLPLDWEAWDTENGSPNWILLEFHKHRGIGVTQPSSIGRAPPLKGLEPSEALPAGVDQAHLED